MSTATSAEYKTVLSRQSQDMLWPMPKIIVVGSGMANICPNRFTTGFSGGAGTPAEEVLQHAFGRYITGTDDILPLYFPHRLARECSDGGGGLQVTVNDPTAELAHGVDESYVLTVDETGAATLVAPTVWGALHGIETLSQLVRFVANDEKYFLAQLPLKIEDAPRFPHRGVLVDTGRHFENVGSLKAIITSLSYAKMNIFHWHVTEDQSFPFPSKIFPDLPEKGDWSEEERYSEGDVKEIMRHAWLRGVRVIPEFDMPGHSSSWRKSIPEIFPTACQAESSKGAFSPFKPKTYEVLEKVLADWSTNFFKDGFMHIGGDEVPTECWDNAEDNAEKARLNVENPFDYFLKKVVDINKRLSKQTIMWDEGFASSDPNPADVVIQVWRSPDTCRAATEKGFRIIRSVGWYLDHLNEDFNSMYSIDPLEGITSPEQQKLVLGGEACMWGEHVDGSNILDTIWPRSAAVAERLWSLAAPHQEGSMMQARGDGNGNWTDRGEQGDSHMAKTHHRAAAFRCMLLRRNVPAHPLLEPGRGSIPNTIQLPGGDNTDGSCYTLRTHSGEY